MEKTRKITAMGMFAALAYVVTLVCKMMPPMFAAFPFLSYDAKDVMVLIGGFVFGPVAAFLISLAVSVIEMFTVSDTNIIGCIMNIASTCAFACTASAVYMKARSVKGAGTALVMGTVCCVATMLVLNFLLTPLYMNVSREAVLKLLIPAILPFNLVKCVLNSAIVLIVYKPFVGILRRANIIERRTKEDGSSNISVVIAGLFLILMCVFAIIIINGR